MLATQNPIESEGTYPLPEAQVDRFLMKVVVDYPTPAEEAAIVDRVIGPPADVDVRIHAGDLLRFRAAAETVYVDRRVVGYAVELADATRRPAAYGLTDLEPLIEFGVSPRGPIGLVQAARALALLRGRRHVLESDVRDLTHDIFRHRLVLSYDALTDGIGPDAVLDRVLGEVGVEAADPVEEAAA